MSRFDQSIAQRAGRAAFPSFSARKRAFAWALLGTFLFTLVYASKKLIPGDVPTFQLLWLRYTAGLLTVLMVAALLRRGPSSLRSDRLGRHALRAVLGSSGAFFIIYASAVAPVADVTAVGLLDGVVTLVFAGLLLDERTRPVDWWGSALCVLGALIVIYGARMAGGMGGASGVTGVPIGDVGTSDGTIYVLGLLAALASAVLIGLEAIAIRYLVGRDKPLTVLLYVNAFAMAIMTVPGIMSWQVGDALPILLCLLLGPLAVCGQFAWVQAYRLERAAVVTPVGYTWIVFAAALGWFAFGEPVGWNTLVGGAIIVVGGIALSREDSDPDAAGTVHGTDPKSPTDKSPLPGKIGTKS